MIQCRNNIFGYKIVPFRDYYGLYFFLRVWEEAPLRETVEGYLTGFVGRNSQRLREHKGSREFNLPTGFRFFTVEECMEWAQRRTNRRLEWRNVGIGRSVVGMANYG
jgi:hypothetical protein